MKVFATDSLIFLIKYFLISEPVAILSHTYYQPKKIGAEIRQYISLRSQKHCGHQSRMYYLMQLLRSGFELY
jgi:hypothetical protein